MTLICNGRPLYKIQYSYPDVFYTLYYPIPCPQGLISRRICNPPSNYVCIKVIIIQIISSLRSNSLNFTLSFFKNPYISSNSLYLIRSSQILFHIHINFRLMLKIYSIRSSQLLKFFSL